MDAGTAEPTEVSCLDVAGSRVCAGQAATGVLEVRVRLADGARVRVYVDESLVAGDEAEPRSAGRHRRPEPG